MLSHFPIALSIAAAGAAIVSLIGHAHDVSAPAGTAWLLAGAVALGLLALIVIEQALADAERLFSVYRPLSLVLAIGAVAAVVVGWVRPAPWLLALLLVVVLSVLRVFAVLRFLSADAWGDVPAPVDQGWVLSFATSAAVRLDQVLDPDPQRADAAAADVVGWRSLSCGQAARS